MTKAKKVRVITRQVTNDSLLAEVEHCWCGHCRLLMALAKERNLKYVQS